MKFSFERKEILDILSRIQGITGKKTTLNITADVLIRAADDQITLTANDLETVFTGTYPARVESQGVISINAKKFFEIVREYPNAIIPVMEVENRWVEIGSGDSMFHIVSSDPENFPETPVIENVEFIEVAAHNLKKLVDVSSVVAYKPDEKRVYVLGSLIQKVTKNNQEFLRVVSTDSRRLHSCDIPFNGILTLEDTGIIIPKKAFSELNKFIDNSSEPIRIGIKDNHFILNRVTESVMIKLLSGQYPDYRPVIAHDTLTGIDVDRTLLGTLMRRVSILTSDDYKSVILNFTENELNVTITNPEIGESKERIAIGYSGQDIVSAFNPRYFIDALNLFQGTTVTIYIRDSKSPCIMRSTEDENLVCVIMAMHIS